MANALTRLLGRARDKPIENRVSDVPTVNFGFSQTHEPVTPISSMRLTAVYACVRVIAETIAGLPCGIYRTSADGKGSEKVLDHPLWRLLHDEPNHEMTSFVWRELISTQLLLWGNAYCQLIRDGTGRVVEIWPLNPMQMQVDRDDNGVLVYLYTNSKGITTRLRPVIDVLHVPALGFDGIMGYSPIALEKNAVGLGLSAERYGANFFGNSAVPTGVLEHPGTIKNPERLRENWQATYGGAGNAGKTAILEEGMKFQTIGVPNSDAQFLETRKFQVTEICRIFRVPPHMIADLEHATFSNIEHQEISFVQNTIVPWVRRLEQSFDRAMLTDADRRQHCFTRFNVDGLMRGDYQSRMNGYAVGRQNGWMSANDIRALEDMPPIPADQGGDAYLVNGNMIPASLAMQGGYQRQD